MCYAEQAPRTAVCEICGATFTPRGNRKYTCSHACTVQRNRIEGAKHRCRNLIRIQATCVICGAEFEQNLCKSRKTCSPACSHELKQRTMHQCQYETRVCSVCGSEFDAARACHASVCWPCRRRHRAEVRGRKTAARAEEKQRRKRLRDAIAAEKKSKIRKSAATPQQPRPLTMAQRARMLRQAIAKSAFQQRARAEMEILAEQEKRNEIDFKNNLNSSAVWW